MMNRALKSGTAILIAMLSAQTAFADVTPQDIWQQIEQSISNSLHADVVFTYDGPVQDGNTLIIDNALISFENKIEEADINISTALQLGSIFLNDNGDGTVSVVLEDSMLFSANIDDLKPFNGLLQFKGTDIIASGTPDDVTYNYQMDRATISTEMTADNSVFNLVFDASGLSGTERYTDKGDVWEIVSLNNINFSEFAVDGITPETFSIEASVQMNNIASATQRTYPKGTSIFDKDYYAQAGVAENATSIIDSHEISYFFETPQGAYSGNVMLGEATMNYNYADFTGSGDFVITDTTLDFTTPFMPESHNATLDKFTISALMPLKSSDEKQKAELSFALENIGLDDSLWSLTDPTGAIPREDITFRFSIELVGKLVMDLVGADPEQFKQSPVEPESMTIKDLFLGYGGASLQGEGSAELYSDAFERSNPAKQGQFTMRGKGLNALLNRLEQAGPQLQAFITGGRIGMAMFARPVGDDEVEAKVELNPEGHIIVNGQRFQ